MPRGTANSVDNRFSSPAHRAISAIRQRLVRANLHRAQNYIPAMKEVHVSLDNFGLERDIILTIYRNRVKRNIFIIFIIIYSNIYLLELVFIIK